MDYKEQKQPIHVFFASMSSPPTQSWNTSGVMHFPSLARVWQRIQTSQLLGLDMDLESLRLFFN